jgi:polysaccharide pyruvyl transferase WcaK-like protein
VPHLARAFDNPELSDVTLHTQLARFFKPGTPVLSMRAGLAGEVKWLTEQAELVISMRHHPLVFAMAAKKAALGIYTDSYTKIKLRGALEQAGLEDWSMPIELAVGGSLTKAAFELWQTRPAIKERLTSLQSSWKLSDEYRWQNIKSLLACEQARFHPLDKGIATSQLSLTGSLQVTADTAKLEPKGTWFQSVNLFERQVSKSPYLLK